MVALTPGGKVDFYGETVVAGNAKGSVDIRTIAACGPIGSELAFVVHIDLDSLSRMIASKRRASHPTERDRVETAPEAGRAGQPRVQSCGRALPGKPQDVEAS